MKDEWNGFAVLLANLIEKYAVELDIDSMPDPILPTEKKKNAMQMKMHTRNTLKIQKQHDIIIVS